MSRKQVYDNNVAQGIASYVDYLNNIRLNDLMNIIDSILTNETEKLSDLSIKTSKALSYIDVTRLEIDNLIEVNRGGKQGIHGFIAEFAEVGIRNARDIFRGLEKNAVLLNNNGPADILLDGQEVQMKFYNNIPDEIKQSSNYGNMNMMFPRDHVEVISKIMEGAKSVEYKGNKLTYSQIYKIKNAIENECSLRGESYDKWLKESLFKYADVQKNTINETISLEADDIKKQSEQ